MRAIQWIKGFIILSFLMGFIVVLINIFVDPYDFWDEWGYNISYNERMKKAYQLQDLKPKSIILGSSRAEYGIDPHHPYFMQPAYSLTFSGATAYESKLYFQKAIEIGSLEKVLLVVGYRFFGKGKKTEDVKIPDYLSSQYAVLFEALFSWDSLKKSINIILHRKYKKAIYTTLGQYDNKVHQHYVMKNGGHKRAFEKNEIGSYANYDDDYIYNDGNESSLEDLKQIFTLAHRYNIEVEVVIGPSHIRQWESMACTVGYQRFLQWKKDIVIANTEVAIKEDRQPFSIWDFAVYHELTSEPVPDKAEKSMEYHFESSHYTEKLGNIVLDTLRGESTRGFGMKIDQNNIDEHIKMLKKERTQYIDVDSYLEWHRQH